MRFWISQHARLRYLMRFSGAKYRHLNKRCGQRKTLKGCDLCRELEYDLALEERRRHRELIDLLRRMIDLYDEVKAYLETTEEGEAVVYCYRHGETILLAVDNPEDGKRHVMTVFPVSKRPQYVRGVEMKGLIA